ncbi:MULTISPECIES: VENN motif pre-toxin domain-containing protein [Xanthomonas]|uniref:VENN motif pre-toxin domain-containing protein n=1 Tax=Xanthomonas TaxID=338 RepID=UPI001EDE7ABF|nr:MULTISPECIES: VENN motif pre-toxin domain-containing protein [Xanthomonas]
MIVSLSQAVGATAGGMTGGSLADAVTTANTAKNSVENNSLGKDDHARLKQLRQKAETQFGLNPQESLELVLLDAGDQMSAGLLKKVLAAEPLTEVQKADLATYYQRYIDQNGSLDLKNLQGIGPNQVYGFPYAD